MTDETLSTPYDYALHSDFLIHWTGKDIDDKYNCERIRNGKKNWDEIDRSNTILEWEKDDLVKQDKFTVQYLVRLRDILKHGFWMTEENIENSVCNFKNQHADCDNCDAGNIKTIPTRTCFTELKISESRKHAREYGRLGIGVKRRFLFERSGRPVVYYQHHHQDKNIKIQYCDQLLKTTASNNPSMLGFFKPMGKSGIRYDYYSESEWRIIFSGKLLPEKLIIDPRDPANEAAKKYLENLGDAKSKLKYLIPLDGQLSMIIYPSLDVKNRATRQIDDPLGNEVYEAIKALKRMPESKEKKTPFEGGNWPIELDLDACRNF